MLKSIAVVLFVMFIFPLSHCKIVGTVSPTDLKTGGNKLFFKDLIFKKNLTF